MNKPQCSSVSIDPCLRAEQAAVAEASDTDHALANRRSAAYSQPPYWPFAPLTPLQQRRVAMQRQALRSGLCRTTDKEST